MSERSEGFWVRDGQEQAVSTRCAERIHDCSRANWGTLSDCCRSLRHELEYSEASSLAKRHVRARLGEMPNAICMHCHTTHRIRELRPDINGKRKTMKSFASSKMPHAIGTLKVTIREEGKTICIWPHRVSRKTQYPTVRNVSLSLFLRRNSQPVLTFPMILRFSDLSFRIVLHFSVELEPLSIDFSFSVDIVFRNLCLSSAFVNFFLSSSFCPFTAGFVSPRLRVSDILELADVRRAIRRAYLHSDWLRECLVEPFSRCLAVLLIWYQHSMLNSTSSCLNYPRQNNCTQT